MPGIISRIASAFRGGFAAIRNLSPETAGFDWSQWRSWFGSAKTDSGVNVSPQIALEVASFWQGVSMISGDIAGMPIDVYRRDPSSDDREVELRHPAEFLINGEANEDTCSFEFWRRLVAHALIWGNGYAWIKRRGPDGAPEALYNLLPDRTEPVWVDGKLYYRTEIDGQLATLFKWEVLHLKGLSIENGIGCKLFEKAREELGLALAARKFGSKFFGKGAKSGGILEIPANFSEKAAKNLQEGFRGTTGDEAWFEFVILREGAKFHATTVEPQKSQLNELREQEARELARFLNMPPFKLGLADSVSYNSSDVGQSVYLVNTLNPWRHAIVGESQMKLLTLQQRRSMSHYLEHNPSKMLETDPKALNEVLEIQRRNEVINANEYRRKIGLNRRKDPGGEEYRNPNTKTDPTTQPGDKPKDTPPKKPKPAAIMGPIFADAVNRISRRVSYDARKQAKASDKFLGWLDSKAQDHRAVFGEVLWPVLEGVGKLRDTDPHDTLLVIEGRFFGDLLDRLKPLVEPPHKADDLSTNVDTACAEFEAQIAAKLEPLVFGKEAA